MKQVYRQNRYLTSTELSQRLTANVLEPRPKPMPAPIELYKDLTTLDRLTYAVWFVLISVYLYWVFEVL
jgi:hypothetical protein